MVEPTPELAPQPPPRPEHPGPSAAGSASPPSAGSGRFGRPRDPALLAALGLALAYVLILAATAPAMGYVRDEGYYFKAAEQYSGWWGTLFSRRFFEAFTDAEISRHFSYNHEHPALVKLTQGITYHLFHRGLGLVGAAQGFRMTGFLFAGLSLLATFLLGRALVSARVGLAAAALLAVVPRYFYDAHLACFDVPMTAMWTLSLWAFWRGLEAPPEFLRRRCVLAGLIFGLALATKLNAFFLPVVFLLVWLVSVERRSVRLVPGPSGGLDLTLPTIPWVLVACAVIAPIVFVAHWPWLWHDTFRRIGGYIAFHLQHEHYPIRYFDRVFVRPPFPPEFSFVMTGLTLPSPMLALGVIGFLESAVAVIARRARADALLLLATLIPIALISLPGTPIFGGVKHWYNAMPLFAILAARTLDGAARALSELVPRLGFAAPALTGALAIAPGALATAASHPNGIGFYNELAGGFRGGAELGMQRSFWGGLNLPLLDEVAALPGGTSVFFDHMNYDSLLMYQREGTLPRSVYFANEAKTCSAATVFEDRENATSEEAVWSRLGRRPTAGVYADEVTLVQFYRGTHLGRAQVTAAPPGKSRAARSLR